VRIALDSNIFIYVLREASEWSQSAREVLEYIQTGAATGVASVLCLSEVLPYPFRKSEQTGRNAQLFMEGLEGLDYVAMDIEVALGAARLRGEYGTKLSLPDAIHLASAMAAGADVFVTNDHGLLKLNLKGALRIHLLGEPLKK
jgi:predicted nucleic acid-binding protein